MPWNRGSIARRVQSTLCRTSALFSSRIFTVSSISAYRSLRVSMVSNVVATMRPTWPRPSRCCASSDENVKLASPTTSASATGSMSSKRLNLPMVKGPGLSGAASAVSSSPGIVMPASSTSSSIGRVPSYFDMTYRKSLWHKSRKVPSSVELRFQRCLKAATASTVLPEGHLDSVRRRNFSAICSQTDFWPPSEFLGCHPDFLMVSTSSTSAVSRTYLDATSLLSLHLSRSCALTPSRTFGVCALPSFNFLRLAAPFAAGWLSVDKSRLRVRFPSTGSRISSGTSSSARSSSRSGTSGSAVSPTSPSPPSSALSAPYSSSKPGTGSSSSPHFSSGAAPSSYASSCTSPSAPPNASSSSSAGGASSSSAAYASSAGSWVCLRLVGLYEYEGLDRGRAEDGVAVVGLPYDPIALRPLPP
mmetsp:Transcript_15153/g.43282  ORF Transcript_15153/g.43282 Transcript_15153/m.43282 type:complete len:417 (-) Transcript_15153:150-1400(-)